MKSLEKQIGEYEKVIENLSQGEALSGDVDIPLLKNKVSQLKEKLYTKLSAWERIKISRHAERPRTSDYVKHMCDDFIELHGDRLFRDDEAIIGGLCHIGGQKFMIIGHEKGKDTESRIRHNFGMPHPEGYRKALRLMKLAEKFSIPIVTFLDTPGAYPGLGAEERGQGWAIAENLLEMSQIQTPIICVVIGEGCSGGALGIGVGDSIGMLEHSYYSVISPEGCASILWKDAKMNEHAAEVLKIQSENLKELGIIDEIIPEPLGGAHKNPSETFQNVKNFILQALEGLRYQNKESLVEERFLKFRQMGQYESVDAEPSL